MKETKEESWSLFRVFKSSRVLDSLHKGDVRWKALWRRLSDLSQAADLVGSASSGQTLCLHTVKHSTLSADLAVLTLYGELFRLNDITRQSVTTAFLQLILTPS